MSADETTTKTTDYVAGEAASSKAFSISTWLFMRCLGLVYLVAFGSLSVQVLGLFGHRGILPADQVMNFLHSARGYDAISYPSLLWFSSSDAALQGLCWGGVFCSLLATLGILAAPNFLLCWLFWLSILTVGRDFLSFQWDILLLETGFISIFVSSWRLLDWPWRRNLGFEEVHPFSVWIYRWLLFRLMFESGLCKLRSGDETWRNLTAMQYHFHTQPLPTPLGWLADKFPAWMQASNVIATFLLELVFPFVMFGGRWGRLIAAAGFVLLQVAIALTGNYAYFNFVTAALCLFLIDDAVWLRFFAVFKRRFSKTKDVAVPLVVPAKRLATWKKFIAISSAVLIWSLSIAQFASGSTEFPLPLDAFLNQISRYRLVNSYGLFATMTTVRNEIQIEGSADGNLWISYDFKFKPQDLKMPPCIVAPHQPRLDWQMWFAALGTVQDNPWFAHLILRMFENSPDVMALFKSNPFPDKPPQYLRAKLYRYTFSDWNTLIKTGEWWRREEVGAYLPAISKDDIHQTDGAE